MARPSNKLPEEHDLPCVAFATELRALRERAGLTLAQLSALSGLSTGTLSTAQNGMSVPSEKTVKAFVEACGERDTEPWVAQREAALRGKRPQQASVSSQAMTADDCGERTAWRQTWSRWEKSGKLTPPSGASSTKALVFWLRGLRAYRSVSFRTMARRSDYSHTTLAAMANGFHPITVRGLLAFLEGCGVATFAEKIEWLALLERTSASARRSMDAAREQARMRALISGGGQTHVSRPGEALTDAWQPAAARPRRGRSAWPRQRAVHVDPFLLKAELQALNRFYGAGFLPILARHTGVPTRTLQRYLKDEIPFLAGDHKDRLAAALMRMGSSPPPRERLALILPPLAYEASTTIRR
ncbi:helix-turn-helix domain-containing protein [Streptomyces pini]|uniref:Helix-turn-helix domain-containing protein n=1 Tax=Streptomyces pini TaxID=1520580 RepID=A0A1I4JMR4_9ACTN|nr:helix-turn-helix transcriptional regulator [Streptomyces pini]SFL67406.1 Helix-turn-helix domain-containing protein [Streptomyces pini]